MRYIADLHIHSRFSRACSPELTLPNIEKWCRIKGINIIGTGDFTHPQWFKEMREQLEESECDGLYRLKPNFQFPISNFQKNAKYQIPNSKTVFFICSTELSCIYSRGGRGRRVHHVVLAPSLEVVDKIIKELEKRGKNLKSDGRPILGIDSEELLKMLLEIDERILLIPAHAWTPWFAIFGSESGFDSIEECFGKMSKHIYAIETGLSSDPAMNWRLSALDKITLISNSDAHSLPNLGREVNVFETKEKISYDWLASVFKNKDQKQFKYTIEFFPEEGKYHFDGHRLCGVRLSPKETKKNKGLCPVCKKPVTVGAMNRIDGLANREEGLMPDRSIPYKSLVPLEKIIAEAFGVKSNTKGVKAEYEKLTQQGGSEFGVLLDRSEEELMKMTEPRIVEAISRVRAGKLLILPGYDGEYGTVKVFTDEEQKRFGKKQSALF